MNRSARRKAIATCPRQDCGLPHFEEGLCVQIMHIGPYATEPATIDRMRAYMQEHGLRIMSDRNGKHHEIYLSDPRKVAPAKMKTVLRHPVEKI